MMLRRALLITWGSLFLAAYPGTAYAHGFGERYDLPVPLEIYVVGAGAAVLLSFIVIGLFGRGAVGDSYPRLNLLNWRVGRALAHDASLFVIKLASVAVFATYLIAGFAGTDEANSNLVPTMTWVVFWVGIAYFSGFIGNIWALISPWKILFGWAEQMWLAATRRRLSLDVPYPNWLGLWPAVGFFALFAWAEIAWPGSAWPAQVATLALAYTVVTFVGMHIWGRDVWLRHGEAFSVVMTFFSKFAPTEVRALTADRTGQAVDDYEAFAEAGAGNREWNLRPWGAGLLIEQQLSLSASVFLIFVLASVSFDGFAETPLWANMLASMFDGFSWLGLHAFTGIKTFGLMAAAAVLFAAFILTTIAMRAMGRTDQSVLALLGRFAPSLVPIALAYHLAHFLSFLLVQGQRIIPLASDPLGRGWNLLGTADYQINIAIVNARFAWVAAVLAIVVGHIAAVYAAHVIARHTFLDSRSVFRSQLPMLVLMFAYTMLSLWIVAQPIVVS